MAADNRDAAGRRLRDTGRVSAGGFRFVGQDVARSLTAKQRKFVAAFVAGARGNATEAARLAGYSASTRQTLAQTGQDNLKNPHVAAAIDAAFEEFRKEGAAIKHVRVAGKNERLAACWRVVDARAARHAEEFGDEARQAANAFWCRGTPVEALTGLLVRKETVSGNLTTVEWSVDVGLLKEMRELEKEIAAEVGEAISGTLNVKHSGNVTHTHRRRDLSALSDEELDQLTELAAKIESGAVAG